MSKKGASTAEAADTNSPEEERELVKGPMRSVVFAAPYDKDDPARVFYGELTDSERRKFNTLFLKIASHGKISNDQQFHARLQGYEITCRCNKQPETFAIAEFKIHEGKGKRILAVLEGREYVLIRGFVKGSKLKAEAGRAESDFCRKYCERQKILKSGNTIK